MKGFFTDSQAVGYLRKWKLFRGKFSCRKTFVLQWMFLFVVEVPEQRLLFLASAGGAFCWRRGRGGGAEWPLPGQEAFPPELAPGLSPALCVNPNLISSSVKPRPPLAFCVEHTCALGVIHVGR